MDRPTFRTRPLERGPKDLSAPAVKVARPLTALSLKCLPRGGGGRCLGPGLVKMTLQERHTLSAPGRSPPSELRADAQVQPRVRGVSLPPWPQ